MKEICILIILFLFTSLSLNGQFVEKKDSYHKKKLYFQWGYNKSWYNHSTLRLQGPGYDFQLKNLVARDRPTSASELFTTYLNPSKLTIPQFNFRIGYFIRPNLSISIGWDHMKYVMVRNQLVGIQGDIAQMSLHPVVNTSKFAQHYSGNSKILVSEDLLTFEHTDGYNYAPVELDYHLLLLESQFCLFSLTYTIGIGAGPVVPRSDVRLFGVGLNNKWNFAGYGASIRNGLQVNFNKTIYLDASFKIGRTNLEKILTTGNKEDKASQKITFYESMASIGFRFGNKISQ